MGGERSHHCATTAYIAILQIDHIKTNLSAKKNFSLMSLLLFVFLECFTPLGMEDMKIKDGQITASSTYHLHKPFYGRLNLVSFYDDPQRTAWCADEDDKEPYLTVDLREEKTISGVALQGASLADNFVTSFKLCHSQDGRKFHCVSENFTGEVRGYWVNLYIILSKNREICHVFF